jgi:hypothetical protein
MPLPRYLILLGAVIFAAGISVWIASAVAPKAALPVLSLVAVAAALVVRAIRR